MEPTKKQDPAERPLSVEIDEATARGIYTNLALITHSETEFLLDFLFLQPQAPKTKVLARLVSSPVHAKRLLWALQDNIQKYEARFGSIATGENHGEVRPSGFYQ
ncbi:MAG: DUF3467 domain-containing protein [Elusimicrobia bacterium]|nr:DUF3467 domain-containing protein [Elusimicrobiota bacterium]MDE2425556.1 DUF3467 domain-containing protein [Elusimicrobiota bacterium]